jgi:hypothetical protein
MTWRKIWGKIPTTTLEAMRMTAAARSGREMGGSG